MVAPVATLENTMHSICRALAVVFVGILAVTSFGEPARAQAATLADLLRKDFDIVAAFKDQADIVLILRNAEQVYKCTVPPTATGAACIVISK